MLDINAAFRSAIVATRSYGSNIDTIVEQALVNVRTFQRHGIAVPTTYDQMLAAAALLRAREPGLANPIAQTFAQGFDLATEFTNLLASLELPEGARVAVQTEKSVEALMLYLAVLRAGCVYLPLNTAYTAAEVAYFLGDAAPALVKIAPVAAPAK